ncbi:hypothetical protein GCM10010232_35130 [Streptomyces amakusaensis]|uniref:Uncharacterized protein n=1 Tax=Streptomyces amakusaensis TaxID=67271 RepID=A0ABW0AJ12_9ACTN
MTKWDAENQQWDPVRSQEIHRDRAGVLERRLRAAAIALAAVVLGTVTIGGMVLTAQHLWS